MATLDGMEEGAEGVDKAALTSGNAILTSAAPPHAVFPQPPPLGVFYLPLLSLDVEVQMVDRPVSHLMAVMGNEALNLGAIWQRLVGVAVQGAQCLGGGGPGLKGTPQGWLLPSGRMLLQYTCAPTDPERSRILYVPEGVR